MSTEFKRPVIIEAEDAMIELCRVVGANIDNVKFDANDGCVRYINPIPREPRGTGMYYVLAWGNDWQPKYIQWKVATPEMFGLKYDDVIIHQDRYKVYVDDVDGNFELGCGCTWEVADKIAKEWLWDCYNETGEHSWVSRYGSKVYVEANSETYAKEATLDGKLRAARSEADNK